MEEHTHVRIDALHRRIRHLEDHLRRIHEHVGLGELPERPPPRADEIGLVRRLLAEGHEEEALRLYGDLTGQGIDESREGLKSEQGGL